MIIVSSAGEMQSLALRARREGRRIGFVPTMGFLHEGHMSLVRLAKKKSGMVVLSSFVNPTQFAPSEDFEKYPRNNEGDDMLCEREGVDIVFRPGASDVYADGHSVYVDESMLTSGLCGASRPGHFRGVLTVVAKLFNIVMPDFAVFGRKDAQQARVIEQMVRDLNFPVEIIVAPIVRESDGLAMSSRNTYLSADERKRATNLYGALCIARRLYDEGLRDSAKLRMEVKRFIVEHAAPVDVEYVETVDYSTLRPVDVLEGNVLVAIAARIGKTRLIDNMMLPPDDAT